MELYHPLLTDTQRDLQDCVNKKLASRNWEGVYPSRVLVSGIVRQLMGSRFSDVNKWDIVPGKPEIRLLPYDN